MQSLFKPSFNACESDPIDGVVYFSTSIKDVSVDINGIFGPESAQVKLPETSQAGTRLSLNHSLTYHSDRSICGRWNFVGPEVVCNDERRQTERTTIPVGSADTS